MYIYIYIYVYVQKAHDFWMDVVTHIRSYIVYDPFHHSVATHWDPP